LKLQNSRRMLSWPFHNTKSDLHTMAHSTREDRACLTVDVARGDPNRTACGDGSKAVGTGEYWEIGLSF
jgi:hypothetical protein